MLNTPRPHSRFAMALLWAGLIGSDTAAQLLFKTAAVRLPSPSLSAAWIVMVAQSWLVWSALTCLLVTFGLWMLVLRNSRLSTSFPVTALTFIGIAIASSWLLGEMIVAVQYVGIALIVAGVAMLRPLDN